MWADGKGGGLGPNSIMKHPDSPFLCTEYRQRLLTNLNLGAHKTFNQCHVWNSTFVLFSIKRWRRSIRQGNIWTDLKWSALDKGHCFKIFTIPLKRFRLQLTESSLNNNGLLYNNKRSPKVKCFPSLIHQLWYYQGPQCFPSFCSATLNSKHPLRGERWLLQFRASYVDTTIISERSLFTTGHHRITCLCPDQSQKGGKERLWPTETIHGSLSATGEEALSMTERSQSSFSDTKS